jgi:putative hydrolase of the HAD superfamily
MFVFDLDDTLYKERDYVDSGRRCVARHFADRVGMSAEELYTKMLQAVDPFDAVVTLSNDTVSIADILDVYRRHMPDIALDQKTTRVLTTLKARGERLGIITDGRSVGQHNKIEALKLNRFFDDDAITVSEDIGAEKTEPLAYEMFKERFADEKRFIYVGDNPFKDFEHPRARGWVTVMLAAPEGVNIHRQNLMELAPTKRPDIVIFDLETLLELFPSNK